jgi:hypothetical protein
MSTPNCEWVRNYLPLFLYNELSFEEEEAVQTHLGVCAECSAALETERVMHAALDTGDAPLPVGLLNSCREQFASQLAVERAQPSSFLSRLRDWFAPAHLLRPVAAMALIAIGFFGGRALPKQDSTPANFVASVAEPIATRVRRVEPSGEGRFQLVLEETRQRVVSGAPDDGDIRELLISAASDPSDAGLRGNTLEILSSAVAPCDETRQAFLQALETDPNDGVRLRALQGLKPVARQADVRRVLARVLLKDPNAGIRSQIIDMLTDSLSPGMGRENDMIGVFQDLMGREQNHYIRMRAQRQLQQVKASTEVY